MPHFISLVIMANAYSEPCQTTKIERFTRIGNDL